MIFIRVLCAVGNFALLRSRVVGSLCVPRQQTFYSLTFSVLSDEGGSIHSNPKGRV